MDLSPATRELIVRTAASFPQGSARRHFMADTLTTLQLGQRQAAQLFGWGRDTLRKALHERRTGITCRDDTSRRGCVFRCRPGVAGLPTPLAQV